MTLGLIHSKRYIDMFFAALYIVFICRLRCMASCYGKIDAVQVTIY